MVTLRSGFARSARVAWLALAACSVCSVCSVCSGAPPAPPTPPASPAAPPQPSPAAAPQPSPAASDAPIVPVRAARAWTTALAPNPRGGWNFITQIYEHGSGSPTEWIVLDLASGKQTVTEGPAGAYANTNYQIA